jgi:hypothetical protein
MDPFDANVNTYLLEQTGYETVEEMHAKVNPDVLDLLTRYCTHLGPGNQLPQALLSKYNRSSRETIQKNLWAAWSDQPNAKREAEMLSEICARNQWVLTEFNICDWNDLKLDPRIQVNDDSDMVTARSWKIHTGILQAIAPRGEPQELTESREGTQQTLQLYKTMIRMPVDFMDKPHLVAYFNEKMKAAACCARDTLIMNTEATLVAYGVRNYFIEHNDRMPFAATEYTKFKRLQASMALCLFKNGSSMADLESQVVVKMKARASTRPTSVLLTANTVRFLGQVKTLTSARRPELSSHVSGNDVEFMGYTPVFQLRIYETVPLDIVNTNEQYDPMKHKMFVEQFFLMSFGDNPCAYGDAYQTEYRSIKVADGTAYSDRRTISLADAFEHAAIFDASSRLLTPHGAAILLRLVKDAGSARNGFDTMAPSAGNMDDDDDDDAAGDDDDDDDAMYGDEADGVSSAEAVARHAETLLLRRINEIDSSDVNYALSKADLASTKLDPRNLPDGVNLFTLILAGGNDLRTKFADLLLGGARKNGLERLTREFLRQHDAGAQQDVNQRANHMRRVAESEAERKTSNRFRVDGTGCSSNVWDHAFANPSSSSSSSSSAAGAAGRGGIGIGGARRPTHGSGAVGSAPFSLNKPRAATAVATASASAATYAKVDLRHTNIVPSPIEARQYGDASHVVTYGADEALLANNLRAQRDYVAQAAQEIRSNPANAQTAVFDLVRNLKLEGSANQKNAAALASLYAFAATRVFAHLDDDADTLVFQNQQTYTDVFRAADQATYAAWVAQQTGSQTTLVTRAYATLQRLRGQPGNALEEMLGLLANLAQMGSVPSEDDSTVAGIRAFFNDIRASHALFAAASSSSSSAAAAAASSSSRALTDVQTAFLLRALIANAYVAWHIQTDNRLEASMDQRFQGTKLSELRVTPHVVCAAIAEFIGMPLADFRSAVLQQADATRVTGNFLLYAYLMCKGADIALRAGTLRTRALLAVRAMVRIACTSPDLADATLDALVDAMHLTSDAPIDAHSFDTFPAQYAKEFAKSDRQKVFVEVVPDPESVLGLAPASAPLLGKRARGASDSARGNKRMRNALLDSQQMLPRTRQTLERMLMRTRITEPVLRILLAENIYFPMSFIVWRVLEFMTACTVFYAAGDDTAVVGLKGCEVRYASDMYKPDIEVLVQFKTSLIVHNSKNIEFVPDTTPVEYLCGGGVNWWVPDTHGIQAYLRNETDRDLRSTVVPYGFKATGDSLPFGGRRPTYLCNPDQRDHHVGLVGKLEYPTADIYADLWCEPTETKFTKKDGVMSVRFYNQGQRSACQMYQRAGYYRYEHDELTSAGKAKLMVYKGHDAIGAFMNFSDFDTASQANYAGNALETSTVRNAM